MPIAVVGVSALFPGSIGRHGFWRDILAGRDLVTDVPSTHWLIDDYYDPDPGARDKTYARRGAFLSDVDFDPVAWGLPPSNVPSTDTNQILALIVAQQVLEDACRGQMGRINKDRTSVILGVTSAQELLGNMVSRLQRPVWVKALREMGFPESKVIEACDRIASNYVEWKESTFPGVLGNVVAGRIANRLDLGGTNCITDAACASSFSALAMAVSELRLHQSDLVITGGADTMNDIFMYVCFSKTPALSPTGDCRPFSDAADGTLLGEGIGMVALKRLADAERDGDRIYAVIKGVGSSSDGRSKSVYAPVSEGQAKAIRRAYDQAGFDATSVELVEAHGTGTRAGDAAEFGGLKLVFEETGSKEHGWCALGSVKSQVGHTKAAAGAAGLFKAVMALHHKILPPTIKVKNPDPKLGIETSPFYLNTRARPWVRADDHPRRAGVSSFGFGGSNFHIAVEEYTGNELQAARDLPQDGCLIVLSAETPDALVQQCEAIQNEATSFLAGGNDETSQHDLLTFWAHDTQHRFNAQHPGRVTFVVQTLAELIDKLKQTAHLGTQQRTTSAPGGLEIAFGASEGKVGFLFPGQGSQYLNMAAEVVMGFPAAQSAWDANATWERNRNTEEQLDRVVFPRPVFTEAESAKQQDLLRATQWAQPAIGATSLAYLRLLQQIGVVPAAVGGHSFGEVTALFAAGVLGEDDFFKIARLRGEVMAQAAAKPGTMVSVSAPLQDVQSIIEQAGHIGPDAAVVIANHNSPRQVVLSGQTEAIAALESVLSQKGVSSTRLDVATAFHSPIVRSAEQPLAEALNEISFQKPVCPVFANTTAAVYPDDPTAMRALLAGQLARPVRFAEQIDAMYAEGVRTFIEVGPSHVLSALCGHILKDKPHRVVTLNRKNRGAVSTFWSGLAGIAASGVALDFAALWSSFATPVDPRLKTKPALTLKINGAGYGKPYPPPGGAAALPKPNAERPIAAHEPAPIAAAPTPATTGGLDPSVQYAWVMAIAESQRQTAEAHATFTRAMAESHAAFLRTAESSLLGITGALGGQPIAMAPQRPVAFAPMPALAPPPAFVPPFAAPPAPVTYTVAAPHLAPTLAPVMAAPVYVAPTANGHGNGNGNHAPTALSAGQLQKLMLSVVAERTGYPEEMVGLDMDLEADLGVDSIKRVEILSAVMERAPGLSEMNTAKMASMRVLREIVDYLSAETAPQNGAAAPAPTNGSTKRSNGSGEGSHRPLGEKSP
jgi:polyketide-type polyunsaturated fatty acid synthase PfaA